MAATKDLTKLRTRVENVRITPDMAEGMLVNQHPVTVPIEHREGVFAFLVKCPACSLEFVTLSWRADRPAECAYNCPECMESVVVLGRVVLSARHEFSLAAVTDPHSTDVEIASVGAILQRAAEPPAAVLHD